MTKRKRFQVIFENGQWRQKTSKERNAASKRRYSKEKKRFLKQLDNDINTNLLYWMSSLSEDEDILQEKSYIPEKELLQEKKCCGIYLEKKSQKKFDINN